MVIFLSFCDFPSIDPSHSCYLAINLHFSLLYSELSLICFHYRQSWQPTATVFFVVLIDVWIIFLVTVLQVPTPRLRTWTHSPFLPPVGPHAVSAPGTGDWKQVSVPGSSRYLHQGWGKSKNSSFLWIRGQVRDLTGRYTWKTIVSSRMNISQGSPAAQAKERHLNRKQNWAIILEYMRIPWEISRKSRGKT